MTNICAIGNSHLAAWGLAWKNQLAAEFPDREVKFVGVLSKLLSGENPPGNVALRKAFRATRAGKYDAIRVCALDFASTHARKLCRRYRTESHAKDGRIPVSDRCFAQVLRSQLFDTPAIQTIGKLRRMTSAPIILVPEPFPDEVGDRAK